MVPSTNGWQDESEEEREALDCFESGDMGKRDDYEGWGADEAGPLYWLLKRASEDEEC